MYVPADKPDIVLLIPEPVIAPGLIVQLPAGKPVNTTLPVAVEQVGCVIVPIAGGDGVTGCALMVTAADDEELHPVALVTVYVYIPAFKPDIVVLAVFPVIAPGLITQFPAGKPVNSTLPFENEQVG